MANGAVHGAANVVNGAAHGAASVANGAVNTVKCLAHLGCNDHLDDGNKGAHVCKNKGESCRWDSECCGIESDLERSMVCESNICVKRVDNCIEWEYHCGLGSSYCCNSQGSPSNNDNPKLKCNWAFTCVRTTSYRAPQPCKDPHEGGYNCRGREQSGFYYDMEENKCKSHVFCPHTSGKSSNKFDSKEECEDLCIYGTPTTAARSNYGNYNAYNGNEAVEFVHKETRGY